MSVQGLDIDSPVKYRRVFVGRVDHIGVAPDSKLIKVVLKIESGQTLDSNIVAQLKSVGITGSMFVELDQKEEDEVNQSPLLASLRNIRLLRQSLPKSANSFQVSTRLSIRSNHLI